MRYARIMLQKGEEVFAGRFINPPRPLAPDRIGALPDGRAAAWRPVVVEDVGAFDRALFQRLGPDYAVEPTRVVERFRLGPRPEAAAVLHARIDARAEAERGRHGIGAELLWQAEEARTALDAADREGRVIEEGEYPLLDIEIGVTPDYRDGRPIADPLEAADTILHREALAREALARIGRAARLLHRDVDALLTDGITVETVTAAALIAERDLAAGEAS